MCQEKYGLDPAHYYTAPGLSWDALLKKTGVELELLTDLDMHLFIERGMRGGISMVGKRHAKANNPQVEGYNPAEATNYITYLDANNLYGWAMNLPLPKSGFHWKRVMPTKEEIMRKRPNVKKGWILEVDLEYPEELHDAHNDYPLAPEKRATEPWKMSEYQRRLMADLGLEPPKTEKLVLTLEDKEKYVVHYKNLQFYLSLGMRLIKGAQSVRVRPRPLDGAVHQDEHGVSQAGQKRLREELLQADEQLSIWKDNGEFAKSRRCEDSAGVGDKQDPQAGIGPVLRQIHTFQQRHGRNPHAQKEADAEKAGVHRNDDLGKQQDTDVRLVL